MFGEDAYPTLYEKGAALLESLAQNPGFHNANKRTAVLCTAVFFRYNGYKLRFPTAKIEEDFVVDVVKHRYTLEEIAGILKENAREN